MSKFLEYDFIKNYIESFKYQLLSKEYTYAKNKLDMICPEGHLCHISFNAFQQGKRCFICGRNNCGIIRRLDIEKVKKDVENNDYTFISYNYDNNQLSLSLICNKHNIKYDCLYSNFKKGKRCYQCGLEKRIESKRINQENKFKEQLKNISDGKFKLIDRYITNNEEVEIYHQTCGHSFRCKPSYLLDTKKCYYCEVLHKHRDTEMYKQQIYDLYNGEYEILGEYTDSRTHILTKHKTCGCEWYVTPSNLLKGFGCPNCSSSKGEVRIKQYLDNHNIGYKKNKTFDTLKGLGKGFLSYDFYLLDYNILIEYQGKQHKIPAKYSSSVTEEDAIKQLKKQKIHDKRKREYAQNHNIKLLEIWYSDFDNIEDILNMEFKVNKIA